MIWCMVLGIIWLLNWAYLEGKDNAREVHVVVRYR